VALPGDRAAIVAKRRAVHGQRTLCLQSDHRRAGAGLARRCLAFYLGLNIEYYQVDKPSTSILGGTAGLQPDPLNYGWRNYGPRVGLWWMLDSLDGTEYR
jgi:hypothetical protein